MKRKKKLIITDESDEKNRKKKRRVKEESNNQKILAVCLLCVVLFVGTLYIKAFEKKSDASASSIKNIFDSSFGDNRSLIELVPINEIITNDEVVFHKECSVEGVYSKEKKQVIINEIAWMGSEESASDEWIEIKNIGNEKIDISYWQLKDKDENIKITFRKNTEIEAGGLLLLERTSDASVNNVKADVVYNGSLANTNESLTLINEICEIVEHVSATPNWPKGDNKTKKTMERSEDGEDWHTSSNIGGTPKQENTKPSLKKTTETAKEPILEKNETPTSIPTNSTTIPKNQDENTYFSTPQSPEPPEQKEITSPAVQSEETPTAGKVIITELMVGKEGNNEYEFIELYNPTEHPINISLWSIRRKTASGKEYPLLTGGRMEGKVINSKSHFLLSNEVGYNGSVVPDATWAKSNTLAYTNNSVTLLNEKGEAVDEVIWMGVEKDQSLERNIESNTITPQVSPNPKNSAS